MKQNAKTLHKNGKWSISLLSKGAYYELWNNALTPLLGIKQIERDWKGKQTNKNHHLGKKENKIPFSEFSSLAVSGSSAGGNAEESMTRGGFTCGLSHSVLSLISKNFHFFLLPVPTPAGLVFLLFIFLSQLFHFIHQILHCVTFKIYIFHLDLTYIQNTRGKLLINNILQNSKAQIHTNISLDNVLECTSDSNVLLKIALL